MQMQIRRSADRGSAHFGWLDSRHTFSFGEYYDRAFMGFGHLRVINEDKVDPGAGFPPHPHNNMEIISYVVQGGLAHRDSTGSGGVIRPGEVQVMTAGRGVAHEEKNASKTEPVHFLQIWLLPHSAGTQPRYDQRAFDRDRKGLLLVVSPDGRDDSLSIGQDADLYRLLLDQGGSATHSLRHTRSWVQVIRGTLDANDVRLFPGDGLALIDATTVNLRAFEGPVEALVFDLM